MPSIEIGGIGAFVIRIAGIDTIEAMIASAELQTIMKTVPAWTDPEPD